MFSKDADRLCVIFNKNPWQNEPELKFDLFIFSHRAFYDNTKSWIQDTYLILDVHMMSINLK